MIQNIWSRIVDWFSNVTDRRELLSSFNNAAKNAYILGITPTLIEARTSVGEISYRHEFSNSYLEDLESKHFQEQLLLVRNKCK